MSLKTQKIKEHAKRRLRERFGMTPSHLSRIATLIKTGQSQFLGRRSLSRSVHRVRYGSKRFACCLVWSQFRGTGRSFTRTCCQTGAP